MRFIPGTGAAALFLLCVLMGPVHAQQDHQKEEHGKPARQQGGPERGAPPPGHAQRSEGRPQKQRAQQPQQQRAQLPPQNRPQERYGQATQQPRERRVQPPQPNSQPVQQRPQPVQQYQRQPQRGQQQAVAWQQQQGWVERGGWQGHSSFQQNRAQNWAIDHRTWAQRGGYGGYYIPQATFSLAFGSQHGFRLQYRPTMYMGYSRFSYGRYSFLLVDPWPEYWADNWYDSADLYIDYDGYDKGYYLYNRQYPDVRLAITVVM